MKKHLLYLLTLLIGVGNAFATSGYISKRLFVGQSSNTNTVAISGSPMALIAATDSKNIKYKTNYSTNATLNKSITSSADANLSALYLRNGTYLGTTTIYALSPTNTVTRPPPAIPEVTTTTGATTYTEGDSPVMIDNALTISSPVTNVITSASVNLNPNDTYDKLAFEGNTGSTGDITGSFNYSSGTITLTSPSATATIAQWQTALRKVTYENDSNFPTAGDRTVSFVINDGNNNSIAATKTITVIAVNNTPFLRVRDVITVGQNGTWTNNGSDLITDDTDGQLGKELLTITSSIANLTVSTGYSVVVTGNGTGNLTILGESSGHSLPDVNQVLRTLSIQPYASGTVTFTIDDLGNTGIGGNKTATGTLTVYYGAPVVTSVDVPSGGNFGIGKTLDFVVHFDIPADVTGTPRIPITMGSGTEYADYLSGSGTTDVTFRYTVQQGDLEPTGITLAAQIDLNGGAIRAASTDDAILTLNHIGTSAIMVDAVQPTVVSITLANQNPTNSLTPGFVVTFSEPVYQVNASDYIILGGTFSSATTTDHIVYNVSVNAISHASNVQLTVNQGSFVNDNNKVKDAAGNLLIAGNFTSDAYSLDLTAPDLSLNNQPPVLTKSQDASFTFSSSDNTATFQTKLDNGAYASATSPATYSNLTDGSHTFYVKATDPATNFTEQIYTWTVDATPPSAPVITNPVFTAGPPFSNLIYTNTFTISGMAEANATVNINISGPSTINTVVNVSNTGSWTYAIPSSSALSDGQYTITTKATDAASNESIASTATLTVNTQPMLSLQSALTGDDATYGSPSASQIFNVTGINLTHEVIIKPPTSFEVSINDVNYSDELVLNPASGVIGSEIYIRLKAGTPAGVNYSGNIVVSSLDAITATQAVPGFTANKAPLIITADNQSRNYGSTNPNLTVSYSGFVNGETANALTAKATASATATVASASGSYAIIPSGALADNYAITYVNGTLAVNKLAISVTAKAKSKTYGDTDPVLDYTFSPALVTGDSFTGNLIRNTGENVGTYAINKGTLALDQNNYILNYTGNSFNITTRLVTITADAKTKTYGDTDAAFTYQITGGTLIGNDTFTGSLTRDLGEKVGTYAIKQGTLVLNDNYNLNYTGSNLTINPAAVTIAANTQTKVYGTADPAFTYQITAGALVGSDSFTGGLTRTAGENVGTYAINQGSLGLSSNYTLTYNGSSMGITPAQRTLVFNNLPVKTYLNADFDPSVTLTSGETPLYASTDPTVATIVGGKIHIVGAGNVSVTASAPNNPNYTFTVPVTRFLIVNKANQTISFAAIPNQIRGNKFDLSGVTTSSGLPVSFTVGNNTIVNTQGTQLLALAIGNTTVTASAAGNANYNPAVAATQSVKVLDPDNNEILVRQALSPNGDGINDALYIEGILDHPNNRVTIVNPSGIKVFEITGYNNSSRSFAGISNVNGQQLKAGTYFYLVEFTDPDGHSFRKAAYFVIKYQ